MTKKEILDEATSLVFLIANKLESLAGKMTVQNPPPDYRKIEADMRQTAYDIRREARNIANKN